MAVGHSPERPVHKRHAAFPPPRGPVMPAPPLIPNMAQQQQEPPDFFPHLPPSGFPLLGPVNGDLVPMEDISTLIFTLIPPSVLPEHIGRHCRRFGPVLELQLGPANVSLPNGVPAQNAYVQFYARQDAEACLMNPDPILHNRFISVAWHMTNLLPKYSEEPTLSHHAGPPGRRPSVVHVVGGPNNDQQQPLPPSSRPPAPRSRSPPAPYERGRRAHPNPQAPLHYQQHHSQTPTSHRSFQPQHQQQQPRPHAPLQFLPLHSCDNTSSFRPPARPAPARNSGPPQSRQPSFPLQPPRHQPYHGHQHQHQHQQQPSNHGPPASQTRSHPQPQRSQEPTGPPHPTAPSHPKPHTLPDRTSIPPAPISSQHAPPSPTNKATPSPQTLQHTREELLKRQFDISRQKETLFTKQVIARRKLVKSLEAKSGTPSDDLSKAKADLEGAELALLEAKREVGNMAGKLKQGETVTSLSQGPGFGGPGRGGGGGGGSAVSSRPRGPMRLDLRPTALKLSSPPQQVPETSLRSFFSNFGQVEHLEKKQGAVVIKYANRRMAENAKNEAKFLGDLPLHLDWYDVRVEGEAGTGELDVRELDEALGLRDGNGLGQRGRGAPFGRSGRGRRGGRPSRRMWKRS